MWATAVYDLGLSTLDFYDLTPRQYSLLIKAHRRRLAHSEMIQAYTTSAVINYSMGHPEEPVQPISFAPNYRQLPVETAETPKLNYTEDEVLDWQARVANLAAELKQGGGAMLDQIRSASNG